MSDPTRLHQWCIEINLILFLSLWNCEFSDAVSDITVRIVSVVTVRRVSDVTVRRVGE